MVTVTKAMDLLIVSVSQPYIIMVTVVKAMD